MKTIRKFAAGAGALAAIGIIAPTASAEPGSAAARVTIAPVPVHSSPLSPSPGLIDIDPSRLISKGGSAGPSSLSLMHCPPLTCPAPCPPGTCRDEKTGLCLPCPCIPCLSLMDHKALSALGWYTPEPSKEIMKALQEMFDRASAAVELEGSVPSKVLVTRGSHRGLTRQVRGSGDGGKDIGYIEYIEKGPGLYAFGNRDEEYRTKAGAWSTAGSTKW